MTDIFHFLTSDDLRLLAEKARRQRYAAGETILREGGAVPGIFVLRAGRVRVEKRFSSPPAMIAVLEPGQVFGEMSFVDGHLASASVLAVEASEVDVLDKIQVLSLLVSVPGFSSRFYQSLALTLSERLRATTTDLASL